MADRCEYRLVEEVPIAVEEIPEEIPASGDLDIEHEAEGNDDFEDIQESANEVAAPVESEESEEEALEEYSAPIETRETEPEALEDDLAPIESEESAVVEPVELSSHEVEEPELIESVEPEVAAVLQEPDSAEYEQQTESNSKEIPVSELAETEIEEPVPEKSENLEVDKFEEAYEDTEDIKAREEIAALNAGMARIVAKEETSTDAGEGSREFEGDDDEEHDMRDSPPVSDEIESELTQESEPGVESQLSSEAQDILPTATIPDNHVIPDTAPLPLTQGSLTNIGSIENEGEEMLDEIASVMSEPLVEYVEVASQDDFESQVHADEGEAEEDSGSLVEPSKVVDLDTAETVIPQTLESGNNTDDDSFIPQEMSDMASEADDAEHTYPAEDDSTTLPQEESVGHFDTESQDAQDEFDRHRASENVNFDEMSENDTTIPGTDMSGILTDHGGWEEPIRGETPESTISQTRHETGDIREEEDAYETDEGEVIKAEAPHQSEYTSELSEQENDDELFTSDIRAKNSGQSTIRPETPEQSDHEILAPLSPESTTEEWSILGADAVTSAPASPELEAQTKFQTQPSLPPLSLPSVSIPVESVIPTSSIDNTASLSTPQPQKPTTATEHLASPSPSIITTKPSIEHLPIHADAQTHSRNLSIPTSNPGGKSEPAKEQEGQREEGLSRMNEEQVGEEKETSEESGLSSGAVTPLDGEFDLGSGGDGNGEGGSGSMGGSGSGGVAKGKKKKKKSKKKKGKRSSVGGGA
jgi:hypothetical protein